jgi:hypothetical protein
LEFVEKNLDTVPVDLKDLVHTAQEDLLVERMQSPELSDVEGELQSLLGDRYNGTGRELYVADVQQRNKEVSICLLLTMNVLTHKLIFI